MVDEFRLSNALSHLLRGWWLIFLFGLAAALIGLGVSYLQPPLYQAEAIFYASIDFTEINFENLVKENGEPYTFTQYDEDLALEVVKTVLLGKVNEAFAFAQSLDPGLDYDTFTDNLIIERFHSQWFLRYRHPDPAAAQEIVNYWAETGLAALKEAQARGDVETYVMVDLVSTASLPQRAIYRNRGALVLAGMVIGLVTGILFVDSRQRFFIKRREEA
jgi:uncharacterized protein involved in exopolysaccharide biosynthesis